MFRALLTTGLTACLAATPILADTPAAAPDPAAALITEATLAAPVRLLASDLFEGRGPGSRGDELTRAYLASQLESLGYRGGAEDGDRSVGRALARARCIGTTKRNARKRCSPTSPPVAASRSSATPARRESATPAQGSCAPRA